MQSANLDNRFSQFPGAQPGAGGFPGLQNLQSLQGGGFNLSNPMQAARPGMGAPGVGQPGGLAGAQQRLPTGGLPSGMQQLGMNVQPGQRVGVPGQQFNPGSIPGLNGLPTVRTGVNPSAGGSYPGLTGQQNLQARAAGGGAPGGLTSLGAIGGAAGGMNANLAAQLQQQQQRGGALGGLGGRLGNFGALGGGGGTGFGAPSGDLLSMLNKASSQQQQQQQQQQQPQQMGQQQQPPQQRSDETPAFNPADFPTLGATGGPQGHHMGGPGGPSNETFAALLNNQQPVGGGGGGGQQGPAFGEEDFPALPGADGPGGGQRPDGMEGAAQLQQLQQQLGALNDPNLRLQQQQQQQVQSGGMGKIMGMAMQQQQQQPGTGGVGLSAAQQPERYGLLGLLSVIRMTDPDLTTLALGTDLTTLGLNLNAPEPLWKTFSSPWADAPQAMEPDFKVPGCYLMTPPRLLPAYFAKFQPDTLFYILYGMPGDEAQLAAAEELSNRGWYYHKEFKAWLTRAPDTESVQKTDRFERGSFLLFDPSNWHVVRKDDLVIEFDKLERPIQLPKATPAAGGGGGGGGTAAGGPPGAAPAMGGMAQSQGQVRPQGGGVGAVGGGP